MQQQVNAVNLEDEAGNPAGGYVRGRGIHIDWQHRPLVVDGERREPTGAFVEGVIEAARQRLEYYQTTKFKCRENERALVALVEALDALADRTADREYRGVEGTHEV